MSFKLMYITNDKNLAQIADENGVNWIFVDLEINGKNDRQGHLDTVISRHTIDDVSKIKPVLNNSKLLVRVNPIYEKSIEEVSKVIDDGADIVMLPYFKTANEVRDFIQYVDKKAKTCLLLETKEAVDNLDEILMINGIDYIHIGLNDLHLSYELNFMFELLSNGTVESIINKIKEKDIEYGFGGIAALGEGDLSSELILNEHIRLGSNMAILSRTFYKNDTTNLDANEVFSNGIRDIREHINQTRLYDANFFEENKIKTSKIIDNILSVKGER